MTPKTLKSGKRLNYSMDQTAAKMSVQIPWLDFLENKDVKDTINTESLNSNSKAGFLSKWKSFN